MAMASDLQGEQRRRDDSEADEARSAHEAVIHQNHSESSNAVDPRSLQILKRFASHKGTN